MTVVSGCTVSASVMLRSGMTSLSAARAVLTVHTASADRMRIIVDKNTFFIN